MKIVAAILVAGKGERFGSDKSLALLGGKSLWRWSFDALKNHPEVSGVGLVCGGDNLEAVRSEALGALFVVPGGKTRKESSRRALEAMPADTDVVLIQDGARPFVSDRVVHDVLAAAMRSGAAAPGLTPTDTLKLRGPEGLKTLDRDSLVAVQTPQGLRMEVFRKGHELLEEASDDLALAEAAGVIPEIVAGDPDNIKVTRPEDLVRAEAMLSQLPAANCQPPTETRTGIGYDIHAFSKDPSRTLFLGGIAFQGEQALEGHSDADALLHAITDALLGAAALGDIGQHFPNTDPRWQGEPSSTFLAYAAGLLKTGGWTLVNIDATVIAERPKLADAMTRIRFRIAEIVGIECDRVAVKATTNEGLGSIGRAEGIAAIAIATIRR